MKKIVINIAPGASLTVLENAFPYPVTMTNPVTGKYRLRCQEAFPDARKIVASAMFPIGSTPVHMFIDRVDNDTVDLYAMDVLPSDADIDVATTVKIEVYE